MSTGPAVAYQPPERERKVAVFGIAFGLLLCAGLAAFVAFGIFERKETYDVGSLFTDGAPRAPWQLAANEQDPGGTRILGFARVGEPAADALEELYLLLPRSSGRVDSWMSGGKNDSGGGGKWGGGDWGGGDSLERWLEDPSEVEPFDKLMERGEIGFGEFRARTSRVRSFASDGTWTESVRVNLSRSKSDSLVLVGVWAADVEATPDDLIPFLEGLAFEGV